MKTALVCVVNGSAYENFAEALFASAWEFFHPTEEVECFLLPGRSGWPEATMYRYHTLVGTYPRADYIFLSDADMLFEAEVGPEILPGQGITATLHPGYTTTDIKPYERRPQSAAFVARNHRGSYFCGGFVGGTSAEMFELSTSIASIVDVDRCNGLTPLWHDESALNRLLASDAPEVVLSPSYCYPDDDSYYRTVWTEQYERKLVALDKTEEQRGERG